MAKSLKEWLSEGEQLYGQAMAEFQSLEKQIEELEVQLQAKKEEVNQVAAVIGRTPVEAGRRPTVQVVEAHAPGSIPNSKHTIAKALMGRGL